MEPVCLLHVRDHKFVPPAVKPKRGRGRCAACNMLHSDLAHHGYPRSLNVMGSGNQFVFQQLKQDWSARLHHLLDVSGLPRDLDGVLVEGRMTFPDRTGRDQGNFRVVIEKAMGDVLQAGGWLEDDTWDRYEFGNLEARYVKGVASTELMVYPRQKTTGQIALLDAE